eukprot:TRINITY_DN3909_c0_g1_i2.p1 TRINITY_DN3909_c0_g1~~TRINITY_DN3909_c0_g1_i2.p1  ORF type:complete len:640 (+),score=145.39 TRINITY_DN3909_c0_g1_i2:125-2044(+)
MEMQRALKDMHGEEAGMEMWTSTLLPKVRQVRMAACPVDTENPNVFAWPAAEDDLTKKDPNTLNINDLITLMKTSSSIFAQPALYKKLQAFDAWIPMQEMDVSSFIGAFEDDIPEEMLELVRSQTETETEVTPSFIPLPGRENDPSAPAFLPVFQTENEVAEYLNAVKEKDGVKYFPACIPLVAIIDQLFESPEEVTLGLNHKTPHPTMWFNRRDMKNVKNFSDETPIPEQPPKPQPTAEDVELRDAQKQLQQLIDGMISYLKCERRSVRFAYIDSEIVADEELLHVGICMATAENDPRWSDGKALCVQKRKKGLKKKRITRDQMLLFKLRQAKGTLKKKPVQDLLHEEEPEKFRKIKRGKWFTVRRPKKTVQPEFEYLTDPLVPCSEVINKLKGLPVIAELKRKAFIAIHDVAETRAKRKKPITRFEEVQPFYDNSKAYAGTERAFPRRAETKMFEKEDTLLNNAQGYNKEAFELLMHMRNSDTYETGTTVMTGEELSLFSKGQIKELVLGNTQQQKTLSDANYLDSLRRYTYLTKGVRAASKYGPPGYVAVKKIAGDIKNPHSYLFHINREHHRPGDGEQVGGRFVSRLERLKQDQLVKQKAQKLGIDVRAISTDPFREDMENEERSMAANQFIRRS